MNWWLVAVGAVSMALGMGVGSATGEQVGCLGAVAGLTLLCGGFAVLVAGTGWGY